ncbi:hypothetical protein CY35_02G159000 [Sphagnum magellanicum]|nr:hypothetical protein CY35_02G159000 [Sphagnum magellanicum]
MCNTLPGTYVKHVQKAPNFVYLTRDQRLLYVFFYSSLLCSSKKFLQPVWRRQVLNSVASLTSFAGCYFLTYGGRGRAIQNRSAENDKQVLTVGDGIEQRGNGIPNCFRRHFETRQEIRTRV